MKSLELLDGNNFALINLLQFCLDPAYQITIVDILWH
jgi:hypothetical protein